MEKRGCTISKHVGVSTKVGCTRQSIMFVSISIWSRFSACNLCSYFSCSLIKFVVRTVRYGPIHSFQAITFFTICSIGFRSSRHIHTERLRRDQKNFTRQTVTAERSCLQKGKQRLLQHRSSGSRTRLHHSPKRPPTTVTPCLSSGSITSNQCPPFQTSAQEEQSVMVKQQYH